MDFAEMLAADVLWGCSVEVLDQLEELRRQAWEGVITVQQWREQDAEIRAELPTVDQEAVREFQTAWMVEGPRDAPDDGFTRVTRRLSALIQPAPTEDDLWRRLVDIDEDLKDPKFGREVQDRFRDSRDRVVVWLLESDRNRDSVSGLPWSEVAQYRVIEDPDLGPIPQYLDTARQLAYENTSALERDRARLIVGEWDAKYAALSANVGALRFTGLPRLLVEAAQADDGLRGLAGDQLRIWTDPAVQQVLMNQTAAGWPASCAGSSDHSC
ncbi:hypothetical protein [Amycolatopsis minnesotensis]|uniref:Uncharacterized protein n=1 Tax=Amycolatopsis minnesotensis TaxID=337894 RepID=A0ABN2SYC1_9PSEU